MQNIAVVGAGLSGAVLTERLIAAGKQVTVFEKSRGTGGRLASARLGDLSGDLGAPYIDSYSASFNSWLAAKARLGHVHSWEPRKRGFDGRILKTDLIWVGDGRNSSLTRTLLEGCVLRTETRIGVIWPDKEGVLVRDDQSNSLGHFDAVICTAPAPQAVSLLEAVPRFAHLAEEAVTDPSWVYLAAFESLPLRLKDVDIVKGGHSCIESIIVESHKPSRSGAVVKVQMQRDWSEENIDLHADTIKAEIRMLLESWAGEQLVISADRIHRWLYNCSYQPDQKQPALWDESTKIGASGDWIAGAGVDGSFNSANYLADILLGKKQSAA